MCSNNVGKYRVKIAGFGLPDIFVPNYRDFINLEINRKGEIQNHRTSKKYKENCIAIEENTTYEKGFEEAIDRLIELINSEPEIIKLYEKCSYKELQIWISLDEDNRVPSIHMNPAQLDFLSKMKVNIDIDII